MSAMASHITSLTIVYSNVYSGAYQRKHQSSASLAFVRGIHRWPVNSPHKGPVTRKMFPFGDVIMCNIISGHTEDQVRVPAEETRALLDINNFGSLYLSCKLQTCRCDGIYCSEAIILHLNGGERTFCQEYAVCIDNYIWIDLRL